MDALVTNPDWLDRSAYPWTPRRWDTGEGELSYVDEGAGSPVVLVHGTPSWSWEWRHAITALSADHRVLAPDHLGFGLSDPASSGAYRPEDHARRLLAWFDAHDLRDVTLVLHDFGGPIGARLALDRPDRVRRIVLLNTWAWPLSPRTDTRWMSRLMATAFGRWMYLRLNLSARWIVPASFGDRRKLTTAVHRHYLGPFPTPGSRVPLWTLAVELTGSDPYYASLDARLGELRDRPTTLVWGLADPAFGPAELERWRALLPDAEVVALPGVGHFPQEEAPEEVARALAAAARVGARPRTSPERRTAV